MAQDPAVKKDKVDAILAAVAAPSERTKGDKLTDVARSIANVDRQIARLQERRSELEDQLIEIDAS